MASAFTKKTKADQPGNHTVSSAAQHESMCDRCAGLMMTDFCMDLLFCIGETEFAPNAVCNVAKLSILSF